MRTTSAASEEAVAPRAPHGDPDIGSGECRRVVDAVADHRSHAGPACSSVRTRTFWSGVASGRMSSTPIAIPTDRATRGWSPVAIRIFSTPVRRRARIVYAASGRTWSSKTSAPISSAVR